MIGNDIIDLNVANNSRWQEQRFLDKLFTQEEEAFIKKDDGRYQNIWRLWSMKESAYKIYSRKLKVSVFNPKAFRCKIFSETSGTVTYHNSSVNTTTQTNSNIIYTAAYFQDTFQISEHCELKQCSQADKSKQLKVKATQAFGQLKSVLEKDISIEKDDLGVPHFFINEKAQDAYLTLTHHGNYGGFAISF